ALAIDGVVAVITEEDLKPILGPFVTTLMREEVVAVERPIMDSTTARFVGQPIAMVVAQSRYLAEDGVDALDVEWEPLDVILDAAIDENGKFLAFKGHYIGVSGAWPAHPWTSLIDPLPAATLLPSIYDIEAVATQVDAPMTNKCPSGAYRGVGWTPGHVARET